jgi:signal transduction histidine kinase
MDRPYSAKHMKVSHKIISGFLILMLLGLVVLVNQLNYIRQMQSINQELSEINFNAALATLRMLQLAEVMGADAEKYFIFFRVSENETNSEQLESDRRDFLTDLATLQKTASSDKEREETAKLVKAFDDFWTVFTRYRNEPGKFDPDRPPTDFDSAVDRLQVQTEVTYYAINETIKERVAQAAAAGQRAVRLSWIAGLFSFLVGIIVAAVFVRAINAPLRRLTQGTRAIAKGHFWHRLPSHGADEFAELARDFNVMSERLGELDQMKKDFVSHVSHDLKAPLASMRQVMHLMLSEIPGPLNEQQKSLLSLSYNSAERLAAMVGNLLDISRMEAGSMEYAMSAHNLLPLIKSVADEFEVQAREKEIRFRLECEEKAVFVRCDRDRIVQVIGNLFENALKFSPGNSDIVTRVTPESKNKVRVSVVDSGPGVPKGHKEKIFNKFHQVKHGKKIAGQGVGLGLAICKTIVEAHGSPIWVEDNPAGGSVFSFVLHSADRQEVMECGQSA